MQAPLRNFVIREAAGVRNAETLVLGRGASIRTTAGGLPELLGARVGEVQLLPSGGDDTQAIRDAVAARTQVRLGPGTFLVSGTINLGTSSICGSGQEATVVRSSHAGAVFIFSGGGGGVEQLTIRGPGVNVAGSTGITSQFSARVYVRNVTVESVQSGIVLEAGRAEITNVALGGVGSGLKLTGHGSTVRTLFVQGAASTALEITGQACSCSGVRIEDCLADGIRIAGRSNHLSGVRVERCGDSVTLTGGGVAVEALTVSSCARGILVSGERVALDGCTTLSTPRPLAVVGGKAVAVTAFHSDLTGTSVDAPHVRVEGASLVTLVSYLRRNPTAVVLTWEADVSAAGGRVVFLQHDFDPARINSGGNFVAL